MTDDKAAALGLNEARGVQVTGIYERGPAANLSWSQDGRDVVLKANGTDIDTPGQLRNLVGDMAPGTTLTLQVSQGGHIRDMKVTLGTRPPTAQGV